MRRRYWAWVLVVLAVATSGFWAQEKEKQKPEDKKPPEATAQAAAAPAGPHVFTISREDAARKNPVRFSQVSVDRGRKLYQTQCAMCHGEKGDGKGDAAQEMQIHPPDLTQADTLGKRTDGELYAIIGSGSSTMPGQGQRLTEGHKWDLVNYLRTLSGKIPLKPTEEELQEGTVEVKKHP